MPIIPLDMSNDEADELACNMATNIVSRVLSQLSPETLKTMLEDSRSQEVDMLTSCLDKRDPKSITKVIAYSTISLDVVRCIYEQVNGFATPVLSETVH